MSSVTFFTAATSSNFFVTLSKRTIGDFAGSFHGAKPDCGAAVLGPAFDTVDEAAGFVSLAVATGMLDPSCSHQWAPSQPASARDAGGPVLNQAPDGARAIRPSQPLSTFA